jgi:hypothetical protein
MKYILITKSTSLTWEYYDNKGDKPGQFNYVEAWEFLASSWPGNKVVVVYNLSHNKVESSTGGEGGEVEQVVKEALQQYKKSVTPKKKEKKEEIDIDRLLTNLAPSAPHKQVKYTQTDFGYQTCSSWCCHQFFVSYPAHRKNTKLPVQAHLCNSTGAITSCESIRCHRGRYFCPLHLEPVECILGTTKNYCLDCLFAFYFHALIELVQGKHITSYNGIFPKYFDKDEVPAKINSLKERIFCGIGFEDTLNKTVYRTSVTDYESQYVRVL